MINLTQVLLNEQMNVKQCHYLDHQKKVLIIGLE